MLRGSHSHHCLSDLVTQASTGAVSRQDRRQYSGPTDQRTSPSSATTTSSGQGFVPLESGVIICGTRVLPNDITTINNNTNNYEEINGAVVEKNNQFHFLQPSFLEENDYNDAHRATGVTSPVNDLNT